MELNQQMSEAPDYCLYCGLKAVHGLGCDDEEHVEEHGTCSECGTTIHYTAEGDEDSPQAWVFEGSSQVAAGMGVLMVGFTHRQDFRPYRRDVWPSSEKATAKALEFFRQVPEQVGHVAWLAFVQDGNVRFLVGDVAAEQEHFAALAKQYADDKMPSPRSLLEEYAVAKTQFKVTVRQ